ncbi:MAG: DICT sensory domain-containing protein [Clostridium sp.]|nr:DICT sensory domain-containing protein [Clostridium sp.]
MKSISLFNELFEKIDGDVVKFTDKAKDSQLSIGNIKYETKVPSLERMCYIMESVVLNGGKKQGDVYAGFQKISRAEAIWDRFLKMADNVDNLYVFGERDKLLPSHQNIKFVYLPKNHPLVREWFLVLDIKYMRNMMTAYDLDGFGVKPLELDRNFKGAKTVNSKIIDEAVALLKQVI